ncbi:MAG: WG repeat-containing protein [Gemmataceae bacterium]
MKFGCFVRLGVALSMCLVAGKVASAQPKFDRMFENRTRKDNLLTPVKVGDLWGYANTQGKIRIAPQFEAASTFYFGGAEVRKDGKTYGISVDNPDRLIPSRIRVSIYREGLTPVLVGNRYGYKNRDGKIVIKPRFERVKWFGQGVATVMVDGKWGIIDKTGKMIVQPQFKYSDGMIRGFPGGYQALFVEGGMVLVDKKGKRLRNQVFEAASQFKKTEFGELVAAVKLTGKWGILKPDGTWFVTPRYDELLWGINYGFEQGYLGVRVGDKWGLIDKTGSEVIKPKFESLPARAALGSGLFKFKKGRLQGIFDLKGNIVVPPQYFYIGMPDRNGQVRVKDQDENYSTINVSDLVSSKD